MNAWSNIQVSSGDPEIIKINNLEKSLGELPDTVSGIHGLIGRFEICHFKYQRHLGKIKDSMASLGPGVDPAAIGANHIHHGETAWKKDVTGRSLRGQQYVWAIREWLKGGPTTEIDNDYDKKPGRQVREWLGDKDPDKIRLVRILLLTPRVLPLEVTVSPASFDSNSIMPRL